ncbi:Sirohydrochlorin ferrochelatase [Actinomyces denticolens]|uniref:Sirohydrochlorin ferrochelatase n=1 Tax=Actinomyces denticolens TaxID=52767 RepID=A0ABY1HZ68_9ACTO|nr:MULTISPECIES: CbiX/SirB N-terminal domain-containing protein [Actinomyces]GAV93573.1 sirohydrochlorin cobaltochelatase [Actinomyces denticolens]SHI34382.1 Sirohydrochlorin ferrochelatase [Actinomyces denticolens]SUU74540.1 sirohydrochlorin cobaltochelatase [Actinomyces denticolens]
MSQGMAGGPRGTGRPPRRLVLLAHGTRRRGAVPLLEHVAQDVAARLPGLEVSHGYVEFQSPTARQALGGGDEPVVVPVFLGSGYHVEKDLPAMVGEHGPARLTGHLGPHPALIGAVVDRLGGRLVEQGARWSDLDGIVLAAAGSRRAGPVREAERAARRLESRLGLPVRAAYLSAGRPSVSEAVEAWRAEGARMIAVATYLLAEGRFSAALRSSGADVLAPPIGHHAALAEVVVERYLRAA